MKQQASHLLSLKAAAVDAHVRFKRRKKPDFFTVLKKRVDRYFEKEGVSPYANGVMRAKSALIIGAYLALLGAIYSDVFRGGALILLYMCLGFVAALNGLNIAHDANHGSYSRRPAINRLLASLWDLSGPSSLVWRYSHNLQHHIYTNIPGIDGDIDKASILRFSPCDPLLPFHRYQHWYAPFLYALSTLNWVFYSDYVWFFKEWRGGKMSASETALFFGFKVANLALFLLLPLFFLSAPFWQILCGFLALHFTAGIFSALVFQLGHLVEGVGYVKPDDGRRIPSDWISHEMMTTSNCATDSRWLSHLIGGLNFQIEHHLFPHVCHVHYAGIADLVKETAKEFDLPYNEIPTFLQAVRSHFSLLKFLGRNKGEKLIYGETFSASSGTGS